MGTLDGRVCELYAFFCFLLPVVVAKEIVPAIPRIHEVPTAAAMAFMSIPLPELRWLIMAYMSLRSTPLAMAAPMAKRTNCLRGMASKS